MYKDRCGYLWIGTDNGVVKYDGYSCKTYNMSTGLVDADVWNFYEDKKGRIWLSRISDEIGYFYNGRYHKVYMHNSPISLYYPLYIREHDNGIMFLSAEKGFTYTCIEQNDTVNCSLLTQWEETSGQYISKNGEILHWENGILYAAIKKNNRYEFIEKCKYSTYQDNQLLNHYLVKRRGKTQGNLYAFDITSCTQFELVYYKDDLIYNEYENRLKNYIITDNYAYKYKHNMESEQVYKLDNLLSENQLYNNRVTYLLDDSLWGVSLATTKSGMYFSFDMPYFKCDKTKQLAKYNYIGTDKSGTNYWWNKENKTLKYAHKNGAFFNSKINSLIDIENIYNLSDNSLLLFANPSISILDKRTKQTTSILSGIRLYIYKDLIDTSLKHTEKIPYDKRFEIPGIRDGLFDSKGRLHCIQRGLGYGILTFKNDTLINQLIMKGKFKDLLSDPLRNRIIIYGGSSIIINSKDSVYTITDSVFKKGNLLRIKSIQLDKKTGDLFILGYNKLVWYSQATGEYIELFNTQKLDGALIYLHNELLVTAGRFGVIFAKAEPYRQTMRTVIYPNIKALAYNNLYDITTIGDSLLINTDNGLISMSFPADSLYTDNTITDNKKYNYTVFYNNKYAKLMQEDTLRVDKKNIQLNLGIVNPTGVGDVVFYSFIDGISTSWDTLNGNEIYLSKLKPGKYYRMRLKASDKVWKSTETLITVYIIPSFWQTNAGLFFIGGCITILSVIILLIVIYYTRRIVSQKHEQENYLLSLELKSIYSQINPHFIFNTLNTGLYFISENKNDDAYKHISTFSELLRSYIKSVRNKYVSLSEEIENLENYILLQQFRFENRFSYTIHIDDGVDTNKKIFPALLLQPFVENAINHGLLNKPEFGNLTLSFLTGQQENQIVCIIDDDGIGREQAALIKQENGNPTESYGNNLIKDLVDIINADGRIHINIEYVDKAAPSSGTKVIITIKTIHHEVQ